MATRIIEFGGDDRPDDLPVVPATQYMTAQTAMTASGTSAQSAAFGVGVSLVCVQSDEAIYVRFGTNPTATTNDYKIAAGGEQFFTAREGQKVAIRT